MVDVANNTTSTASFETAGQFTNTGHSYTGQFETTGDEDWIPIFLQAGTAYSFTAGSTTEFGAGDIFLRIFNGSGAQVASDNDSGAGANALASITPGASGIFYVSVSQFGGLPGEYGIFVSSLSATNEVLTASVDGHAAVAANARVLGGAGNDGITMSTGLGLEAHGEQGNDTIEGNSSANLLSGGTGSDTIHGAGGNDKIWGDAGDDDLFGEGGTDYLFGGDGIDTLDGGDSFDFLRGGAGNDTLKGGAGADTLDAGAGNDVLDGGTGVDQLAGGAGNDRYIVDSITDTVSEALGSGVDTIEASIHASLLPSTKVKGVLENLTLLGSANLMGTGNGLGNKITGNSGGNTLQGADGNDTLDGAGGNDTLFGEVGNDKVYGGGGNDTLSTDIGDDLLFGDLGNDALNAGAGKDQIWGGVGADVLTGGGSADRFMFGSTADSSVATAGRDRITDFVHDHGDRIDLSGIDASSAAGNQAFSFIGVLGFTNKSGQLHLRYSGGNTIVEGDLNGNGTADFAILLTGLKALVAGDFVL
jgi:Ca2+-binding RTX toxin-like protein